MSSVTSLIGRFFKGIKAYFGAEFRYYTITFFFFLILVAIFAPLFIILDVKALNNIEIVYIVGSSSALVYLIYMFLTMSSGVREIFFRTKWKYLFGILVPFGGTVGLSYLIFRLIGVIPNQLEDIVNIALIVAFLIWLVVQLIAFGLLSKDIDLYLLEKVENNDVVAKRRLIIFSLLFEAGIIAYLFLLRRGFTNVQKHILPFNLPFDLWILPIIITVLASVLLIISLIRKKYHSAFFSTSFILIYSLYLLYHIGYLMILYYVPPELYVGPISVVTLVFFAISIVYTLQAISGTIKSRSEKWWQPISFFLFSIVLLYVTWSITLLYNLATYGRTPDIILEETFWAINHFISYIFGIILLIVTVFVFTRKLKIKKEVE